MAVIAHVSDTFEQNDEARTEIYLVKIKPGNLSQARAELKSTTLEERTVLSSYKTESFTKISLTHRVISSHPL